MLWGGWWGWNRSSGPNFYLVLALDDSNLEVWSMPPGSSPGRTMDCFSKLTSLKGVAGYQTNCL